MKCQLIPIAMHLAVCLVNVVFQNSFRFVVVGGGGFLINKLYVCWQSGIQDCALVAQMYYAACGTINNFRTGSAPVDAQSIHLGQHISEM